MHYEAGESIRNSMKALYVGVFFFSQKKSPNLISPLKLLNLKHIRVFSELISVFVVERNDSITY